MKKIIYSLCFSLLFFNFALANDVNNMTLDRMPSDAEIMKVINQYDFDDNQKQLLFRQTKAKLQMMYNSKATMGEMLGTSPMNNSNASQAQITSDTPTVDTPASQPQTAPSRTKKYAQHDSLIKRTR